MHMSFEVTLWIDFYAESANISGSNDRWEFVTAVLPVNQCNPLILWSPGIR